METIPRLVRNAAPAKYFCVFNWYATWYSNQVKMFLAPEEMYHSMTIMFSQQFSGDYKENYMKPQSR
jgi:hypothetical protein